MKTPYFLWDHDLSDNQVRQILRSNNETEKNWLTARILNHAKYDDIWKYLSITDIVGRFKSLKLRPTVKSAWQNALTLWGYHV